MRVAVVVAVLAALCLAGAAFVWARAVGGDPGAFDPGAALARFEHEASPRVVVDVGERYAGKLELVDPGAALPSWHRYPRGEAVRERAAEKACPPPAVEPPLSDAALARALAWHAATCAGGALEPAAGPWIHPSGRSYAAMTFSRTHDAAWLRAHAALLHVLEIPELERAGVTFDDETHAVGSIDEPGWAALTRGDAIVLTGGALVLAEHGPHGIGRVRFFDRAAWGAAGDRAGVALAPRGADASCARAASPDLCWVPVRVSRARRAALLATTVTAAILLASALSAIALLAARARRAMHLDRVHVLRTLTHELRTPATSLLLDIEPLRTAYDDLPPSCQEPMLRLSDDIERLHRVLQNSVRFMALFEPSGARRDALVHPTEVASAAGLFADLVGAWPADVSVVAGRIDGPFAVDTEWLGFAVKNLVENAARHGAAPVVVAWELRAKALAVRVTDAGTTPRLSLGRAILPFGKGARSEGLGFGLAMVARIADLLGGKLTHEPRPTTFELVVPVTRVAKQDLVIERTA